ncbi:chromate transporter [Inhella gelatinilytica]|uniref:Chromate transporter n=1 Tax=Inhella gelatinilytica TaxID=2795030 RepID=A0A931NCV7_9BURK|nr:chromate transporter [Inhella gelatinilytica]MBH9551944.1 chromate transporter [Inhella gelatinilytica]
MSPSCAQALRFWVLLGWVSFGGPAAQIALMHRELVERRRWVDEARFQHALAYCMTLPGPEAQQLATYLGWALHGRWMGLAAGLLFILPGWGLMMALGWLYMTQGQEPLWQALLAGLKPAIVALVAWAAWRMARRSLTHPGAWGVAGLSAGALALGAPYPLILVGAIAYALLRPAGWQSAPADPREIPGGVTAPEALLRRTALGLVVALGLWGLPLVGLMWLYGADGFLVQSAVFFTQAALVTFGGAYAVLPYVM